MREVANLFGMSLSSVYKVINTTMDFLVEIAPKHIYFPRTVEEKEQSAKKFEEVINKKVIILLI